MCCDKNLRVRPGQTGETAVHPTCCKKDTYEEVGGDEHNGCQSRQTVYCRKPSRPPPLQATIVSMYQVCSEVLKVHSQYQAVTNLSEIDYPRLLPSSHDRTP